MITPNKFVTFDQSIVSKLHLLLEEGPRDIELGELYKRTRKHFEVMDEFVMALDVLYVLNRINIDFRTRTVSYVG